MDDDVGRRDARARPTWRCGRVVPLVDLRPGPSARVPARDSRRTGVAKLRVTAAGIAVRRQRRAASGVRGTAGVAGRAGAELASSSADVVVEVVRARRGRCPRQYVGGVGAAAASTQRLTPAPGAITVSLAPVPARSTPRCRRDGRRTRLGSDRSCAPSGSVRRCPAGCEWNTSPEAGDAAFDLLLVDDVGRCRGRPGGGRRGCSRS